MNTYRNPRSESGAILPLFALMLLMLLGFAAFGVDLTAAYAETREAQSTADAAVLAAGLEFLDDTSPSNEDLYDAIKQYTVLNWGPKAPTDADWAACQDPDKPADYVPIEDTSATPAAPISDCISLKQVQDAPTLLRVRLPDYAMPTSFATLLGFDTIAISATATAELRYSEGQGAVLPFSVPANAGAEECLATPPSGLLPNDPAPCGGPTQGNFGMFDSPWFGAGDPHFTEAQACPSSPQFRVRTPHNIALGLDHVIRPSPEPPTQGQSSGPPVPAGADNCTSAASGVVPYVMLTETGNNITSNSPNCGVSIFECGFLGDDPSPTAADVPGRLRQASNVAQGTQVSPAPVRLTFATKSKSYTVDNVGLWEYLLDPAGDAGLCDRSTYEGLEGRDLTDRLIDCLDSALGTIFDDSLLDSPRFAIVPRLNYNSGSQFGTKWWDVLGLQPVYLHTTWYTCSNGNPKECLFLPDNFADLPGFDATVRDSYSILFSPGEGSQSPCELTGSGCEAPAANRWSMMGLSALVLDWDWFSEGAENQFGGDQPFEIFLHNNE
ncbi:MAG TPA: Tad domain-containing protein [Acidimicrobiia bacterium]|nr:Tad domain-containing protein [Acidimicrobiia bacterium]